MNFLILDFLFDLASGILGSLIPDWSPKTKFEKNIERLKEEPWFTELENDYRYGYIIHSNRRVKKFLSNEKNVNMLISEDNESEKFVRLVIDEHTKFTRMG